MIGCLVIAFALCQPGYQAAPAYYAPAPPPTYYAPAYAVPVYPMPAYAYGAPVALNLRFGGGGWGGYGHHWHR